MPDITLDFLENPDYEKYYSKLFSRPTIFPLIQTINKLSEQNGYAPKKAIKENMRNILTERQINNKLKDFTDAELLKESDKSKGNYSLTDTGCEVLKLQPPILEILDEVIYRYWRTIDILKREKYREMCKHILNYLKRSREDLIPIDLGYYFKAYQKSLYNFIKEEYKKDFKDAILDYLSIYDSLSLTIEEYLEALYSVKGVNSCEHAIELTENLAEQENYPQIIEKVDEEIKKISKDESIVEKHKKIWIYRLKKHKEMDLIGFLNEVEIGVKEFCYAILNNETENIEKKIEKWVKKQRAIEIAVQVGEKPTIPTIIETIIIVGDVIKVINPNILLTEEDLDLIREYYRLTNEIKKIKMYISGNKNKNENTLLKLCITHLKVDRDIIEESNEKLFIVP